MIVKQNSLANNIDSGSKDTVSTWKVGKHFEECELNEPSEW